MRIAGGCLQWWQGKLCTVDFKIDKVYLGYYLRNYIRIHFIYKVIAR